jgi:hypothetical protein
MNHANILDRYGKLLEKARGSSSSRLVWRMRTWTPTMTSKPWKRNDGIGSWFGVLGRWISERCALYFDFMQLSI